MALVNSKQSRSKKDTHFLALSDLMTALMLIFLFITVTFFRILPDKDILAKTTAENASLQKQIKDLIVQRDNLNALVIQLNNSKKNTDQLLEEYKNSKKESASLLDQVTALQKQIDFLSHKIVNLNEENAVISNQFSNYKNETLKAFEGFKKIESVRAQIYADLKSTFEKNDFARYGVTLDPDLTIKFNDPNAVFPPGSANIRPAFASVLDKLLPAYYDVLLKYKDSIRAVRIDGHTDPTNFINAASSDSFLNNLVLSSQRASSVLEFLRHSTYFNVTLNKDGVEQGNIDRDYITFWTTASGYSYSHVLDDNRQLTFYSQKPVNNEYSRRVEIRVVTADDSIVKELTKNLGTQLPVDGSSEDK